MLHIVLLRPHDTVANQFRQYIKKALFGGTQKSGLINYPLIIPYIPETCGT